MFRFKVGVRGMVRVRLIRVCVRLGLGVIRFLSSLLMQKDKTMIIS